MVVLGLEVQHVEPARPVLEREDSLPAFRARDEVVQSHRRI